MTTTNTTAIVCVYCDGVFPANTQVCPECNEYKGLVPITAMIERWLS